MSIPVFVAGRLVDPEDAEARARRAAARISFRSGRALYADPHWCLKAFGKVDGADPQMHRVQRVLRAPHAREGRRVRAQPDDRHRVRSARICRAAARAGRAHGAAQARARARRGRVAASKRRACSRAAATASKSGRRPRAPAARCTSPIAAPDKLEVEPVWSYRWQEVQSARRAGEDERDGDGANRYAATRPIS